mgnify:CR=1 FL=1
MGCSPHAPPRPAGAAAAVTSPLVQPPLPNPPLLPRGAQQAHKRPASATPLQWVACMLVRTPVLCALACNFAPCCWCARGARRSAPPQTKPYGSFALAPTVEGYHGPDTIQSCSTYG